MKKEAAEVETAEPTIISTTAAAETAESLVFSVKQEEFADSGTVERLFIPVSAKNAEIGTAESLIIPIKTTNAETGTAESQFLLVKVKTEVHSEPFNCQIKSEDVQQSVNISNTPVCEKCEQLFEDCLEKDAKYQMLKARTDCLLNELKRAKEAYQKLQNDLRSNSVKTKKN